MQPKDVGPTAEFIKQTIIENIQNTDVLSDAERAQLIRNIEYTLDEYELEVSEMLDVEIASMYEQELYQAMKVSEQLGFDFKDSLNSMVHTDALDNIIMDSMLDMKAAIRTSKLTSITSINSALETVNNDIATGILLGSSSKKIRNAVADTFNKHGMKAFITVDGKALPLDFYSETLTRTKLSKARTTAHANHYKEVDNQYFTIHGSYDTCAECASYRDIIFTMTGEDDRFTYLNPEEVIPFHPNCKCNIRPEIIRHFDDEALLEAAEKSQAFNPDVDSRTKAQREAYEKDQSNKRKAREELKQYQNIVSKLGNKAPKTLGAFRRMKRKNSKGYQKLMNELRNL